MVSSLRLPLAEERVARRRWKGRTDLHEADRTGTGHGAREVSVGAETTQRRRTADDSECERECP